MTEVGRRSPTAVGRVGEEVAARFLEDQGYRILRRNLRFRSGEIDLVAEENGILVFVEVKTRSGSSHGTAAEAVTPRKQAQLIRLASLYLARIGADRPCRFDVVTVEPAGDSGWQCALIRDAFGAR